MKRITILVERVEAGYVATARDQDGTLGEAGESTNRYAAVEQAIKEACLVLGVAKTELDIKTESLTKSSR